MMNIVVNKLSISYTWTRTHQASHPIKESLILKIGGNFESLILRRTVNSSVEVDVFAHVNVIDRLRH